MQQLPPSARKGFFTATAVALALIGVLSGCSTASPDVVSRSHAQQLQSVRYAVIESMRPVVVDGSQSGLGAIAGAVAGGVAGSSVGGSREGLAVGVLGAVLGGALGNAVERSVTRERSGGAGPAHGRRHPSGGGTGRRHTRPACGRPCERGGRFLGDARVSLNWAEPWGAQSGAPRGASL